jgi:predicted  nucleic acid-binding Zn-ribbon protein
MKSFRFESIYLLSREERKARAFSFHPKRNLVVGRNHTGKSTLIKNLFQAIGARPTGKLLKWNDQAITAVRFSLDGEVFQVVNQSNLRALFDEAGDLLFAASNHEEWSEKFSGVLGFNLVLTNKKGEPKVGDSRCFFLPFYVNQDGSWQSKWDTFVGMQQYKKPQSAILEYFTGIKPPKYYEINSQRELLKAALEDHLREMKLLIKTRNRVAQSISFSGPKLDPENFDDEVRQLSEEVTALNSLQERLRDTAVRQREAAAGIALQIDLAKSALATYEKDTRFLNQERPILECPTCGAEHIEPYMEYLGYAEDARVLRDFVARLRNDEFEEAKKHADTTIQLHKLDESYRRVTKVLDTRRGDLTFGYVVESIGAERAFESFSQEEGVLQESIDKVRLQIADMDDRLAELASRERSVEILGVFRAAYADALFRLNLPSQDTARARLTSRPNVSGSGGPRSLLAYYSAIWAASVGVHGFMNMPLVVDSPNQQGQDDFNLPLVLGYLAEQLPEACQVIVGTEMDTEHTFDKTISLDEPYKILKEDMFESVAAEIDPLVARMYAALA